jgi:hypothetical protein
MHPLPDGDRIPAVLEEASPLAFGVRIVPAFDLNVQLFDRNVQVLGLNVQVFDRNVQVLGPNVPLLVQNVPATLSGRKAPDRSNMRDPNSTVHVPSNMHDPNSTEHVLSNSVHVLSKVPVLSNSEYVPSNSESETNSVRGIQLRRLSRGFGRLMC